MDTSYVLIQCDLGAEADIIKEIEKIPEVKEVRGTYGIYDIFCKIQTDDKTKLDEIITSQIRKVPRLRATITLHSIPSQGGR